MKYRWKFMIGLLCICLGCSKGNTAIAPVGGGLDESEINQLDLEGETFGRPVPGNPEEGPSKR